MPAVAAGLSGIVDGGRPMLVRISRESWLMDLLDGILRFAPAALYLDPTLDSARRDDELKKTYRRPGQVIQITGPEGRKIETIGDVFFSAHRALEQDTKLTDVPYWMCSFSSDLDPRLFEEFGKTDPTEAEACLIVFEPNEFVRRALSPLNDAAPLVRKSLFPVNYFDPHYTHRGTLSARQSKDFRYAYEREMRFVLDPEGGPPLGDGGPFFVKIDSIADIAGVFSRSGRKLAGIGPDTFLA